MPLLRRALAFGVGVAIAAMLAAWLAGLLPEATQGYAALGAAVALAAGVLAVLFHARVLDRRAEARLMGDGRLLGARLQSLLGAAFAVKLASLVLGLVALRSSLPGDDPDAKFAATAAFCIAFASASVVCQIATVGYLARTLGRRSTSPHVASAVDPHGRLAAGDRSR